MLYRGENPGYGDASNTYYTDLTSSGLMSRSFAAVAAAQSVVRMDRFYWAHSVHLHDGTVAATEYYNRIASAPSGGTFTGTYVEANMAAADWAVYQAGLQGIYLMVPLFDNWNYYHSGLWWMVHQAYLQNSSGITDVNGQTKDDTNNRQFFANTTGGLRIRALAKDYISHWLNHVNPYTGLSYKNDPTIAIVETGNEIYFAAQVDPGVGEWTQDIASYIKSIAPNKLVADGSAASGQAVSTMPGLVASAVDIVGGHYYPQDPTNGWGPQTFTASGSTSSFGGNSALQQRTADVTAAVNAGKVYINGEYPWTRTDVAAWYSGAESNPGISADFYWSFIGNTTAGVPDVHGGAFGSEDYPVHYPLAGTNETTYAPALIAHTNAMTGGSATTSPTGRIYGVRGIATRGGSGSLALTFATAGTGAPVAASPDARIYAVRAVATVPIFTGTGTLPPLIIIVTGAGSIPSPPTARVYGARAVVTLSGPPAAPTARLYNIRAIATAPVIPGSYTVEPFTVFDLGAGSRTQTSGPPVILIGSTFIAPALSADYNRTIIFSDGVTVTVYPHTLWRAYGGAWTPIRLETLTA